MISFELLKKFCGTDETRPALLAPFSEGDWTYATDGRLLIRIPRMAEVPERTDAPKNFEADILGNQPMPLREL